MHRFLGLGLSFLTRGVVAVCILNSPAIADTGNAKLVERLIAEAPKNYFPRELEAVCQDMAAGNFSEALKAIPSTLSWRAARPDKSYALQGLAQYALADYKGSIISYRRSLQTKPSNSDTLYLLALSQQADGAIEPAIQSVEESLFFAKHAWIKPAEVFYEQGLLLSLKPDSVKAIAALAQSIKLDAQNDRARVLLARLYQDSGNRSEAIRLLREGSSLQPTNAAIRLGLAKALVTGADRKLNRSDIEESVKLAADVASSAGNDESAKDATLSYIRSLIAAGSLDAATEKVEQAAKRFPADADVETLRKQVGLEKEAVAALAAKSTPSSGT